MLISPNDGHFEELTRNCFANPGDMDHLNCYPYANQSPTLQQLLGFLRCTPQKWLVQEAGQIVGFFVCGNFIPHQPNAFGMGIGKKFVRQGFGENALREFIKRRAEFSVNQINGYCSRRNKAMICLMNKLGFVTDSTFRDLFDRDATKHTLPI